MVSNGKPEDQGPKEDAQGNEAATGMRLLQEFLHPPVGKRENGALPTSHLQDTISKLSAGSGSVMRPEPCSL